MGGLRYQDSIPLRWQPLASGLSADALAQLARDAEQLLTLLAGLENVGEAPVDDEPRPRYLQQLELRLQLMTELLGELISQTRPLPSARPVALSADRLEWQDDAPPAAGTHLIVELYLHRLLPRPLRLPVRVDAVDGQRVAAGLADLGDSVIAELEKLIFRQHRRAVANSRQR
jgi:hypothetical protein